MVKSIEATVYIDRIRELAGGITTSRPGRGRGPKPRLGMALGSLGALPEDLTSLASLYRTRDSRLRTCLRSLGAPPTLRGRRLVIFYVASSPRRPRRYDSDLTEEHWAAVARPCYNASYCRRANWTSARRRRGSQRQVSGTFPPGAHW